jgi:hypothetical protein
MVISPTVSGMQRMEPRASKEFKDSLTPFNRMERTEDNRREDPAEKSSRSSFSSVRENDSDLAQTFTSSKVSSYSRLLDAEAVDDQPLPPQDMATQTQFRPPITQPHSRLHGCWFPAVAADGFQGWKQIGVRGKPASRSFGDLQALKIVWATPATPTKIKGSRRPGPGQAPIERLPLELLSKLVPLSNASLDTNTLV